MVARGLPAALLLACLVGWPMSAGSEVPVPRLTARVSDLTATLSSGQQAALEQRLQDFERAKGSQVAVLVVPTTAPETIEQYSLRVVEAWKLGRKKIDDGVLLIVAKDDRALRIEVGYGLEGVLPDAIAKRIIEEIIVPQFRAGSFAEGIQAGVEQIIKVIDGEPLPPPAALPSGSLSERALDNYGFLFMGALLLGSLLRSIFGRLVGGLTGGALAGLAAWFVTQALLISGVLGLVIFIIILLSNGSGGRSSSGGFSRSSGGGFSGGGGSFGGGGASGRW